VYVAPQTWWIGSSIAWSPLKVSSTRHPPVGSVPVFDTVTSPWNPPGQELTCA